MRSESNSSIQFSFTTPVVVVGVIVVVVRVIVVVVGVIVVVETTAVVVGVIVVVETTAVVGVAVVVGLTVVVAAVISVVAVETTSEEPLQADSNERKQKLNPNFFIPNSFTEQRCFLSLRDTSESFLLLLTKILYST